MCLIDESVIDAGHNNKVTAALRACPILVRGRCVKVVHNVRDMPLRDWPSHSIFPSLIFSLAVHGVVVSGLSLSKGSWELRQLFQPTTTVSVALVQNRASELLEDAIGETVVDAVDGMAEGALQSAVDLAAQLTA